MSDEQLLAAIDAAIEGNPTGVTEYEIHGRRVSRMNLNELMRTRALLQARVSRARDGGMLRVARPRLPRE